jgi:hypothetical protein
MGSARVAVWEIGTAPMGCQNFFGGLASKISATGFGLALGPDIMPKTRFDPKRPPACGGKASCAPRGCQSVLWSGPTAA